MVKYVRGLLFVLVAAGPSLAGAQISVAAVERPTVVSTGSMLASNTEVWLALNQELTSKSIRQGQKFDVTVARDVMLGNYIVIPRGTPGHGQIGYRTGKGAFGKSAKMEFDLVDVVVDGSYVPLAGHYRIEGQGNTGATVGAVVVAPVLGAFVTGRSAVAAQGTEWKAFTRAPLSVRVASASTASEQLSSAAGLILPPRAGERTLSPYEQGRLQAQRDLARGGSQ